MRKFCRGELAGVPDSGTVRCPEAGGLSVLLFSGDPDKSHRQNMVPQECTNLGQQLSSSSKACRLPGRGTAPSFLAHHRLLIAYHVPGAQEMLSKY